VLVLVGVDVGGTKTHVLAADDQTIVLDHVVPTASWRRGGLLSDEGNVPRLLALFSALPDPAGASLVVGAHGLDSDRQVSDFAAELRRHHPGPSLGVNDVELLVPAAGFGAGVAMVVGTGSKVVGHDERGHVVAAGGFGFLLSDWGSAPALSFAAAKAVLAAHDAGAEPDELAHALMTDVGASDLLGVAEAFSYDVDIHTWGARAPLLFDAASAGSALADAVIDEAADLLALGVAHVLRRGAVGADVVCAGGVITAQPRMFAAVGAALGRRAPGVRAHLLDVAPVRGALALARTLASPSSTAVPAI
jgi:N-acetylglucosamine kinase-like BadF-type ATPase